MKNKIVKSMVFASIATLMIACNPKKEELEVVVVDNDQIKKEIQSMENAFTAAYNSGNMESLEYYDKDDKIGYIRYYITTGQIGLFFIFQMMT